MSDRDQERKRNQQDTSSRTLNQHSTVHTQQVWNNSTVVGSRSYPPNSFEDEPQQDEPFWYSKIVYSIGCYIVSAVVFFLIFQSQLLDTGSEEELKYLAIYIATTIAVGYLASYIVSKIVTKKRMAKLLASENSKNKMTTDQKK
ncbi:hypothetical protein [Bavariicoccus seileri]|uniref:hypothetical protein n=1 Tax=Bavariicoccus seileri TaxID=549685 RepID=UPI0003B2E803|nr:hypothetical protein [Bavariicoccus seileri]